MRTFTQVRLGIVEFIRVRVGSLTRTWVLSDSRRFTPARIAIVGFRVDSLDRSLGFAWDHSWAAWGPRVYSCSRGFTTARLVVVVGFAWVYSGGPRCRRSSRGFPPSRLAVVWYIRDRLCSL